MIRKGKPPAGILGLGYCEKHNIQFPLTIDGCPACRVEKDEKFVNVGLLEDYKEFLKK